MKGWWIECISIKRNDGVIMYMKERKNEDGTIYKENSACGSEKLVSKLIGDTFVRFNNTLLYFSPKDVEWKRVCLFSLLDTDTPRYLCRLLK